MYGYNRGDYVSSSEHNQQILSLEQICETCPRAARTDQLSLGIIPYLETKNKQHIRRDVYDKATKPQTADPILFSDINASGKENQIRVYTQQFNTGG